MRRSAAVLLVSALLLPGTEARGQAAADGDAPRVASIVFRGTGGVNHETLRDSIVTQETRCRGFVLRPLCAISDAGVFVEKHHLDRRELALDEVRIRVVYYRRGYREARVASSVTPDDEGVTVTFEVDEGPLTRVASLTVEQTEPVLSDDRIAAVDLPEAGEPLDVTRLDAARALLRNALWDRGHADAEIRDSATVDPATHTADLHVRIVPGPVATIDSVEVEGNERVSSRTIRRLFGFGEGDVYRRTDMTAAQRRLYETELFRQSLVSVPPTPDSSKTVVIAVREAPPRAFSVGPGFNTVDFVQGEARFTRYDWLGGARRLDARAAVGNILAPQLYGRSILGSSLPEGLDDVDERFLALTWQVGVDLTQPFFMSDRTSLGLGVSAHRRSLPGIVVDRGLAVSAAVTRRVTEGLPVSLTYRFEETRVEAGEVYFCVSFGVCDLPTIAALGRPNRLSPLALSARIERTNDPLEATRGYRAQLDVEHASSLTASDFHHQRVTGEVSRYQGFGDDVLGGRLRAGWVRPLDGTRDAFSLSEEARNIVHPRRRLLAGGARSVRGFAENQLGPRVLTVPPGALLLPAEEGGTPPCTEDSLADATCDPNGVPSAEFRPRPLGGNTLLEGSLEYRHPLTSSFTGAVFVDAGVLRGRRLNLPPGSRTAVTPGFGVRYLSPIGRVRVDIGIRPTLAEDLPVVTEMVDADGVRRLVQLETMKRYDPLEGGGGFLRQIFSRLQLHLAIGEAF